MDALQSWAEWPSFIKETLDPKATKAAKGRNGQSTSEASYAPEATPVPEDFTYVVPRPLHGKHGSMLGKIHTIDPRSTGRTLCGWRYTNHFDNEGHIFSGTPYPFANPCMQGAVRCSTCTRCEEQLFL